MAKMKTNQKTVVHDPLCFQEFTISIKSPEYKSLKINLANNTKKVDSESNVEVELAKISTI